MRVMSGESLSTTSGVDVLLTRLANGDAAARGLLIERSLLRLTALARRQLGAFPGAKRWEETEDVVQGVSQRLHRALADVKPASAREFFALCSVLIRRELIDLKRRHFGPEGIGGHHASPAPDPAGSQRGDGPISDVLDTTLEPAKLARWTELHAHIAALPDELRESFDLLWYQELTHAQAAGVLGVSIKTISRRWRDARLQLHHLLEGREI